MKDVLIITSYFPPETGAASNRIYHLANGLKQRQFNLTVVTPLPNYPSGKIFDGYKGKFKSKSTENGINIQRLWIYASNSKNKLLRLIAMLSYSFSLIWFFLWNKIPKLVIVQSPPLLVAFTCMFFLNSKNRKLVLNVSDLWPIAGLELGAFKKNFSYRMLERIEHYNYKNADLVLGQSNEILEHVKGLFPEKRVFLYRNYPDFEIPTVNGIQKNDSNKIKIVYAGLLGIAQGILKLCQSLDYSNIEFHVYGKGAEQQKIEEFIASNPNLPICYYGEMSREELHKVLLNYDLTIIPLLNRIYGSVPSKIFEYARLGLPMIYFGGGEGEDVIRKYQLGWIANSGDYNHLNAIINGINKSDITLMNRKVIQKTAEAHFDFGNQFDQLVSEL
ncbi:glycosyltransferase family 4 protein [Subsaxibacter sp. CAU 1640]|uniref:glycosyltransferase family 4 protein n=1 Tax=Subsaxibacter sp. CAU 1640 TaxID=2933271 RepID=UPI0020064740|nr:glycosyltransferase family 4 protein [Subsaxibacter sp. CAU 1640]MCK7589538.1 glycosyltransferase family 4 protein [Subsaxibacter sp. CAU 1640]